jgi:hypothetical protein
MIIGPMRTDTSLISSRLTSLTTSSKMISFHQVFNFKKFKNPAQFLNLISFLTDRVMSYQGRNSLSRPKFSSLKPLKNYFTNESELCNQLINYPDG